LLFGWILLCEVAMWMVTYILSVHADSSVHVSILQDYLMMVYQYLW